MRISRHVRVGVLGSETVGGVVADQRLVEQPVDDAAGGADIVAARGLFFNADAVRRLRQYPLMLW
jgi:hypothetical protein